MAILIGEKRKDGMYFVLMRKLFSNDRIGEMKAIIVKGQHNCRSDGISYSSRNPFLIPIKHEYCLIFQKSQAPCKGLGTEPGGGENATEAWRRCR